MEEKQTVKNGDKVKVHYTGRLESGEVFDSSRKKEPLQVTVGSGMVIQGFEEALIDMEPGEKKTATISPKNAYGEYDEKLILKMPRERIPEDITPKEGMDLQLVNKDGQALPVKVKEIEKDNIILDANHPLAGKKLVFDIEVLAID
ncbi:MAG: FKBP-type peptidyl-prolyl cis-trans isomerase [Acidobacteriota bacterium]